MKIDKNEISEILKSCGLKKNEIFFYMEYFCYGRFIGNNLNDKIETLFEGIIDVIGKNGTLALHFLILQLKMKYLIHQAPKVMLVFCPNF